MRKDNKHNKYTKYICIIYVMYEFTQQKVYKFKSNPIIYQLTNNSGDTIITIIVITRT